MIRIRYFLLTCILCIGSGQFSYPAIFTVTSSNNTGTGTLRDAITLANAGGSADTINFQIPGSNWIINLTTTLPSINYPLTINGNTQSGSSFPLNLVTIYDAAGLSYGLKLNANNITITGLKFQNFTLGSCILSDQNGASASTLLNVSILSNVFQDSRNSISAEYAGFQNLNIKLNKFWHCSDKNIDYTPRFLSRNVSISDNEFSGDSLSTFSTAISFCEFAYPTGHMKGVTVSGNFVRNCHAGIVVAGFTKIDSLRIISNTMGYGGQISFASGGNNTDTCKNVIIENNTLDSLSSIVFACYAAGDTSVYQNVTVKNNDISGTIWFYLAGTSPLYRGYFSNVNIENNLIRGINFDVQGTGNCTVRVDSLSVVGNTISNAGPATNGFNFSVIGTGSYVGVISNLLIRRNSILNAGVHGIAISHSSISSAGAKIDKIVIDSNIISGNNGSGVYMASQSLNGVNRFIRDVLIQDNEISNNAVNGISLESNYSNPFTGIHILRNSIYGNGVMGIFETASSLYANPKLPEPVLDWVNFQSGTLAGHIKSKPSTAFDIQFYANYVPGNNGIGEGRIYFATIWVFTDTSGYASFQVSIPSNLSGLFYSATATDVLIKSTSEFSNAIDSSTVQSLSSVLKPGLHSFPSPANDFLFISKDPGFENGRVMLFDLSGRICREWSWEEGVPELMLEVSSIPEGMYLLQLAGESMRASIKITIQH